MTSSASSIASGPRRTHEVRSERGFLHELKRSSSLGMLYGGAITVFYLVIFVIPFGTAIWLSLQNWDFIVSPKFVGVRNFQRLFMDKYFWKALRVTVMFSVVEITVAVALALLLALLLSRLRGRWERLFLSLFYLPLITPSVVTVYLWQWLYRKNGGPINALLASLGLPEQPFMGSPDQALWAVTLMVIWTQLGGVTVILLSGIKNVPESLHDAAKIDGAGFWQQFFLITMPLIRPVLVYQVVASVIGTVQMFEPFFLMQGPAFSTRNLAAYTYELGFKAMNLGYGAAVSMVIFCLLLFATVFQLNRWQVDWEY